MKLVSTNIRNIRKMTSIKDTPEKRSYSNLVCHLFVLK